MENILDESGNAGPPADVCRLLMGELAERVTPTILTARYEQLYRPSSSKDLASHARVSYQLRVPESVSQTQSRRHMCNLVGSCRLRRHRECSYHCSYGQPHGESLQNQYHIIVSCIHVPPATVRKARTASDARFWLDVQPRDLAGVHPMLSHFLPSVKNDLRKYWIAKQTIPTISLIPILGSTGCVQDSYKLLCVSGSLFEHTAAGRRLSSRWLTQH